LATQTNNLGLTKPAGSDYVQVNDFNVNSDVLDAAIGKLSELRTQVKTSLVEAINEAMISGGTDSPYINKDNGHWMQWNNTLLKFEDTGVVAQGSMWYNGTSITGTSATASVFPTGITLAHVGDLYLNTNTSLVYWCAKEGNASVATWRYLCSIKGAQGIQGNTGPTGTTFTPAVNSQGIISWSNDGNKLNPPSVSIKGPKGDPGTGLDIRGTYATLAELQAAVQSPQQGWMYNVGTQAPYRVYMYDSSNGWLDQGQLQGPTGSTGKSAYNAAVEGGYQGNEDTFNAQMAGMPTHIADTNNPHSVTKSQLGLGDVDNTSDLEKPISKDTQTALNTKVSMVIAEIPKGRMRGDVDGDGKITENDAILVNGQATSAITLTGADLWCADINGDGLVRSADVTLINRYLMSYPTALTVTPTFADYYNNWTYHKVDDTSGYWTTELSIPAITTEMEGNIIWSGAGFTGTFIKAEAFSGGVRIYANYPPIEALPCAVSYHTGTGGQFIITNTGVSETGAKYVKVSLTASGWSEEKKQIISIPGLKRDVLKQLIIPTQPSEDIEKYYSAGIRISARGDNTLTFSCDTIPTESITVALVIIPIVGRFEG